MPRSRRTLTAVPITAARFVKARTAAALVGGLLVCALAFAPSAFASTPTVNLGQASAYAIISGASVANTGNLTTVRGDIGAPSAASGFPPGVLDGTMEAGSADTTAYNDFLTAYAEIQSRTGGTPLPALAGATLTPGLYTSSAAAGMAASTVLTLDAQGNPNAVFVIQVNGALALGAGAQVKLTGDAQASNVFWAVNGAFSIGATGGLFTGTVLASTSGSVGDSSVVNGRVLAETAVTTADNQFYSAPPTMTLTGGASQDINNSTPTISGTTDVGTTGTVTVTVAGQTLTTNPASNGSWSVNPTILANGTYPVQAQTTDGAGNVGSATQQLTIDTVPPVITLNGAPSVTTNNPSATIFGTTDTASGTLITVDVDGQTLTAVVQSNGTWNVAPETALGDGVYTVTASVTDPAGNTSTTTEQLTVDTVAPVTTTPTPPVTTPPATTTPVTTTPVTATPVATPTTPTTPTTPISLPTPAPAPQAPKRVSLSSHTLSAQHSVKVSFTLAKAGTVQLTMDEMVHGKAKAVGTVTVKDKAGKDSYKLTERLAGHKLGRGSYRLNLEATSGKLHSKAVTQKLSVR
jgi:hypothetical protein